MERVTGWPPGGLLIPLDQRAGDAGGLQPVQVDQRHDLPGGRGEATVGMDLRIEDQARFLRGHPDAADGVIAEAHGAEVVDGDGDDDGRVADGHLFGQGPVAVAPGRAQVLQPADVDHVVDDAEEVCVIEAHRQHHLASER